MKIENDYYYEPTGGTARDEKHFKEDLLNVCGNFAKTSLDCIEKQNNELEHLQNEKQQLISFLEDKIKENKKILDTYCSEDPRYIYCDGINDTLQEVLDFVEKGGKQ